jgi:hypothetical protein
VKMARSAGMRQLPAVSRRVAFLPSAHRTRVLPKGAHWFTRAHAGHARTFGERADPTRGGGFWRSAE